MSEAQGLLQIQLAELSDLWSESFEILRAIVLIS